MEKVRVEALKLAKEHTVISEEKINIIKNCFKSILYHEELWIKESVMRNFDHPMGYFDVAPLSHFIGYWLFYSLHSIVFIGMVD